jgi:hypothetical protein
MKKYFNSLPLIVLILLGTQLVAIAQPYSTAVGLRLGGHTRGVSVKKFVGGTTALEGIASIGRKSFMITGLFEKHTPFPSVDGFSWFFGGGAHVGFYDEGYYYFYSRTRSSKIDEDWTGWDNETGVGLDFIIGLEYKFQNAPVDIAVDLKPFVDFIRSEYFGYWDGALTLRFTL